MKMPALMTQNIAVIASSIAVILKSRAAGPNCTLRYTVKRIRKQAEFCRRGDDFQQHPCGRPVGTAGSNASTVRRLRAGERIRKGGPFCEGPTTKAPVESASNDRSRSGRLSGGNPRLTLSLRYGPPE